MESWNDAVHVAMIGTDKRQLNETSLPGQIKEHAAAVKERPIDKEEVFLSLAALIYNYRQCGIKPSTNKDVHLSKAAPEEREYANVVAHQVLNDILAEDSLALLSFWLQWCSHKNRIVLPELVPVLLELAFKNRSVQPLVIQCAGKRGEWLASLNDRWKFSSTKSDEDLWQVGSLEQRKLVLQNTRKKDPAKARELLQSVWSQENAAARSELLKQFSVNLNKEDTYWLETLLQDKSEKVKEVATDLLKRLPSSSVVQKFWQVIQQSVILKEGKKILGIGTKNSLIIELNEPFDETILKWGIEKLSNQKSFSDHEYIMYQLIEKVPPHFWQEWLQLDITGIVSMFRNEKNKKYLRALGLAASMFNDKNWLSAIIEVDKKSLYLAAFSLIPHKEQETYAIPFLVADETAPKVINELIANSSAEWSLGLTKAVLQYTAKRPYQYNNSFYNQIIQFIPINIIPELDQCTPTEEYYKTIWNKTTTYITKLLTLKHQTIQAFQNHNS